MQKQELIANIITLFPAMMKKFRGHSGFADIPKQQFMLLHTISEHDNMPMNFYSERLLISKPNLTVLADKLIEAGYVERGAAQGDRRRIVLKMTDSGREYRNKIWRETTENISRKFEKMDSGTLERLNELIVEMSEIINKFDNLTED